MTSIRASLRRAMRAERRELRLEDAGVPRTVIDELSARVSLARLIAPEEAERYRLDDLLDYYADVAIAAHQRSAPVAPLSTAGSMVRRALRVHTIAWQAKLNRCAELAEEIADLIRLCTAMAVTPGVPRRR